MNRSPLIRSLALAAALLALVSLPAQAQPRGESIATIASRVWQAFLDTLPGFAMKTSSAAGSTAPGDRGAGLDPDGTDRGADLDPNGFSADGDRSASLDPNG